MAATPNAANAPVVEILAPTVDLAKLTARTVRESRIDVDANAPRTPERAFGTAHVTSGTRPVGKSKESVIVIVDGSQREAFPQAAVLLAIVHGIIPRAVVDACLAQQAKLARA